MIIGGSWLVYTRLYLGQISAAMEIPIGYVYLIVPVAGLLICYYAVDAYAQTFSKTNIS
jgi:TRAP-type C4-dicarboxylate transport system permease small subunit